MSVKVNKKRECLNDIIKPLHWLYLFSISIASTTPHFNPHTSILYRAYIVSTLIALTVVAWTLMTLLSSIREPALFNVIGLIFVIWLFHFLLTTWLLYRCKKNKIKKLMQEIEELDRELDAIDARPSALSGRSKAWVWSLTAYHAMTFGVYMYGALKASMVEFVLVTLLAFVKLVHDSELACISCFANIISSRVECLAAYLQDLLARNDRTCTQQLDILCCYRKMLHACKRVNSIWQTEMFIMIVFECYFTVRTVLSIIIENYESVNIPIGIQICQRVLLAVSHVMMFVVLGAAGHQLASHFDRVHALALTISVSHLPEWARTAGWGVGRVGRVGSVPRGRLRALDVLTVDGTLPLRAAAALLAVLVLTLQFHFDM